MSFGGEAANHPHTRQRQFSMPDDMVIKNIESVVLHYQNDKLNTSSTLLQCKFKAMSNLPLCNFDPQCAGGIFRSDNI